MLQLYRIQDIQLSDVSLKEQYYNLFLQGNINQAQQIYKDNPQLQGKVINADILNQIINSVESLENLWFNNVPLTLSNLSANYQISIDELIYMATFNPSTKYEINNFVLYNDEIYFCIVSPPVGTLPTNTTYWLYLGLKGKAGDISLGITYKGEWINTNSYKAKDMVVFQNNLYVARTDNTSQIPNNNPNTWLLAVEIIPRGIYVSTTEPPNLTSGDMWLKII